MSTYFELPQDADTDETDEVVAPAAPVAEPETDADASLSRYLHQHLADIEALPTYRPRIGVIIPAYNEAESIEDVLRGLLAQTRLPDEIHVIVNNTKDDTFELAAPVRRPAQGPEGRQGPEAPAHRGLRPRHRREPRQEGRRPQLRLHPDPGRRLPARRRRRHDPRAERGREARGRDRLRHPHRRHLGDLLDRRQPAQGPDRQAPHRRPAHPVRRVQHAEHAPRPQHGRPRRAVLDLLDEGPARGHGREPPADPVGQRLRGRGLAAQPADQVRRLPHQDLRPGPRRRRRDDHGPLARRPAGQVELRRHRPDVAGPARRHEGPALPPEPAAALGRELRHGDQHLHPHRLRRSCSSPRSASTPSSSRRSG